MGEIEFLKIYNLADNLVMSSNLQGQWGLSMLLEMVDRRGEAHKVIFDTGGDKGSLMHNIEKLKVNLGDVECVVLSHGHADHTSSTVEIVSSAGGVRVYAHPHLFLPRFYIDPGGRREKGGVPEDEELDNIERAGGEVILSTGPMEVLPGCWTTGEIPRVSFEDISPPMGGGRRVIVVDGVEVDDRILDDQALFLDVDGVGPIIVTGCAHAGIVNTLIHAKKTWGLDRIHGIIGGLHLLQRPDSYIERTLDFIRGFEPSLLSPCHCTGFKAMAMLWKAFPESFLLNFSGRVIEPGKIPEHRIL
jgi:7,8-dihydropterin-6-yl-methyl-4-(beta-D-ribofuranosyl)aminobenzene 5'-phosphate synthase